MLADINGNLADLRSEAAMASQRFCLRWNNHQSNLLSVFDQLLHDEAFVDVTLAVDGRFLKAHKMVLSACSPYFQALFVGHPDKHPIVILKDVPYADMKSLLDFMYRGEVSVDQDRLTAFLRVAESLRIKGLTEVNEDKCDIPSITSSLLGNQNSSGPGPAAQPPNLHRINQLGHMPQKRYHHQVSTHPLLGSALTAPKRKRGRPRKLSGSSDTPMDVSGHEQSGVDLVQGSPEMMEMKMGLDFQSEGTGHNSSTGSAGSNDHDRQHSKRDSSEVTENGTDQTDASLLLRIKGEPDPTPSTSAQAKDEEFTRPHSRQGSESFKQGTLVCLPSDTTFEVYSGCTEAEFVSDDDDNDSTSASEPCDYQHQSVIINHADSIGGGKKSEDGVHFITDEPVAAEDNPEGLAEPEVRKQLLEYLVQKDGSVVCKWCGEVLPSRSRWYRHKYKLHVQNSGSIHQQQQQQQHAPQGQVGCIQPAPLFKCQSCNAYFKSRKGYIGHLSSRHSGEDAQLENDENREEVCNAPKTTPKAPTSNHQKKITDIVDWEQQREKEEKLVADIIDRVKRECEAQGETVTRRGYSRRTTVMNS